MWRQRCGLIIVILTLPVHALLVFYGYQENRSKNDSLVTYKQTLLWHSELEISQIKVSIGGEIGAARSFLETDGQMKYVFEPTSHVNRNTKVEYALTLDIEFGKYTGIATGMGMRYYGQSTPHTTVLLKDDVFDHDFSSTASVKLLTIPLLVKAGVRRKCFSIFVRAGIVPSIIIKITWSGLLMGTSLNHTVQEYLQYPSIVLMYHFMVVERPGIISEETLLL